VGQEGFARNVAKGAIREVAASAGVSLGLVQHYFLSSKAALRVAVDEHVTEVTRARSLCVGLKTTSSRTSRNASLHWSLIIS
jgi:AcrR family transcriptional regulator